MPVPGARFAPTPWGTATTSCSSISEHTVPARSYSVPSGKRAAPRCQQARTRTRPGSAPTPSATNAISASKASATWCASERRNASPTTPAVPAATARNRSRSPALCRARGAEGSRRADRGRSGGRRTGARRWQVRRGARQVRLTRGLVAGAIREVGSRTPPFAGRQSDDHRGVAAPARHMARVARDMADLVQKDRLEVDAGPRRVIRALLPGQVGAEDEVALAPAVGARTPDDRHRERLARDLRGREADLRASVAEPRTAGQRAERVQ